MLKVGWRDRRKLATGKLVNGEIGVRYYGQKVLSSRIIKNLAFESFKIPVQTGSCPILWSWIALSFLTSLSSSLFPPILRISTLVCLLITKLAAFVGERRIGRHDLVFQWRVYGIGWSHYQDPHGGRDKAVLVL